MINDNRAPGAVNLPPLKPRRRSMSERDQSSNFSLAAKGLPDGRATELDGGTCGMLMDLGLVEGGYQSENGHLSIVNGIGMMPRSRASSIETNLNLASSLPCSLRAYLLMVSLPRATACIKVLTESWYSLS